MLKWISVFFAAACFSAAVFAQPAVAQPNASPVTEAIHELCQHIGLDPSEIGFTYCVTSLEASIELAAQLRIPVSPIAVKGPGGEPSGADGFFRSPPLEQRAREGGACMSLGLPENSPIFLQCVSSLDSVLMQTTMNGG
jgi:hypothetical protein